MGNASKSGDSFRSIFAFWDILYNIHPMFMNCRSWMYGFGIEMASKFDALDDIRRIIVNMVNHIDEMIDIGQDLSHYFGSADPGHDLTGPYWTGQSIGSLLYYSIGKDNEEAFYDPAAGMELGEVPW